MTAKDFTALTTQANTTLADNVTRDVSAADVRQMVIDVLDSVNESTLGILGWTVDVTALNDLIPKVDGQGIGSSDASPAFVAIGGIGTDVLEGLIARRTTANGGGIVLGGFHGDPSVGLTPNAPVELAGSSIIQDGTLFLIVQATVIEDHFLITKPSVTLPDGRRAVPVVLGAVTGVVPESATPDSRNIDVSPNVTEVDVISPTTPGGALTLTSIFPTGSQVNVAMVIEETNNNNIEVTVRVKRDPLGGGSPATIFTDVFNLRNNRINYFESQPIGFGFAATDVLSLHIERSGGTGVNVRGDVTTSKLEIQS